MAPPVATTAPDAQESLIYQLKNAVSQQSNGAHHDVSENYDGDYRFAPIEEAQVSRAMIKRYVSICCEIARWAGLTSCQGTSI